MYQSWGINQLKWFKVSSTASLKSQHWASGTHWIILFVLVRKDHVAPCDIMSTHAKEEDEVWGEEARQSTLQPLGAALSTRWLLLRITHCIYGQYSKHTKFMHILSSGTRWTQSQRRRLGWSGAVQLVSIWYMGLADNVHNTQICEAWQPESLIGHSEHVQ